MNQDIEKSGSDFEVLQAKGVVALTQTQQDFATHIGYEVALKVYDASDPKSAINLGLYFPDELAEQGILKPTGIFIFLPEKNSIVTRAFNEVELIFPNGISRMNQSEALYGFISWLTTRSQPVILSGKHTPYDVIELIKVFMKENNLPLVRENWTDYLVGMGQHEQPQGENIEVNWIDK